MTVDMKKAYDSHHFSTAGFGDDATCDNCHLGVMRFKDSPSFCPEVTNTQTDSGDTGDFHELLMLYGRVCSEDGYLSTKAVTMRMDIAVLAMEREQEAAATLIQKITEHIETNEDETQGCLPQQYRKKPVVIEAVIFTGENGEAVALWCGGTATNDRVSAEDGDVTNYVRIDTLEGNMMAAPGDYIIKGVQDEFYPCKPDIFEKTYEQV